MLDFVCTFVYNKGVKKRWHRVNTAHGEDEGVMVMGFCESVKAVPITDYAERCGYTVIRKGKYYSLKEHDSVIINTEKNCFWRNSRFQKGYKGSAGSVIDFAIEFCGARDAKEAMRQIASVYGIEGDKEPRVVYRKPAVEPQKRPERKAGNVLLPEKDADNKRVYAYLLKTRRIEQVVIRYFLGKKMLYQDTHKNCVFHTGTTFGCLRGTETNKKFILDLEGCDYDECFFIRPNAKANTLIVAESVIDVMSIMSQLVKEGKRFTDYSYLALSGVGKMPSLFIHLLKDKRFNAVVLAFDNDEGGEKATRIAENGLVEYGFNGRYAIASAPSGKDWNEYVQSEYGVEPTEQVLSPILNKLA